MTLELQCVHAAYGDVRVLHDVSLTVPSGRVVALLGPNGAGKTTLLRVASGVLRPTAGRLELDGVDVGGWRPFELANAGIAHVPEGRGIFRSLTVRENLVLLGAGVPTSDAIERAVEAFPRLGERLEQIAGTLSGGEQQMLALARAYISSPTLVLLDEVSMGLAPRVVDEIFQFLTRLAEQGTAMLLVEQYVTRALAVADYVYFLDRGRIGFAGEPAELEGEDVFRRYLATA